MKAPLPLVSPDAYFLFESISQHFLGRQAQLDWQIFLQATNNFVFVCFCDLSQLPRPQTRSISWLRDSDILILKGLYDARIPLWEFLNLNVLAICIIFSCIVSRASIASNMIWARQSGELLIIFISNVTLQSGRTTPLSWLLMALEKTPGNYRRVWGPWYDAV